MTNGQTRYNTALYLRLSKDDGTDSESSSIQTQKEMLTRYCRENGFAISEIYVDDGWSGTNSNRPSFQRMLSDIEDGKINCVITKDLSRLGRNYLETGGYTEVYFPEHNVRYIAVTDGVDTAKGSTMDITPFKNLLNDMYAQDISKKIKSSLLTPPASLKSRVAARLISGHIPMMDKTDIASTIINGLSFCGFTIINAFFFAIGPTRKKSRMKAIGPMMISSWNAARKTSLLIPPLFREML